MIIKRITLNNFGSYEGLNTLDTNVSNNKNIVLFGGKNGAGKTTLFRSIGLCLYGYSSFGYANQSSKYVTLVKNLINNKAKAIKPSTMFVEITLGLDSNQQEDIYTLKRSWIFDKDLKEDFEVIKNNKELGKQEIADFEKYLLSIIPPEMFNLYFFDGEKITDFFTDQEGNKRLKNAFLTLCGYDTFDIMSKNFKRNSSNNSSTPEYEKYLELKSKYDGYGDELKKYQNNLNDVINNIKDCDAEIDLIEKNFTMSGGVTDKQWKEKEDLLKIEEKNREEWNYLIKKYANEMVPFLIVRKEIKNVKNQVLTENKNNKLNNFIEILNSDLFKDIFAKNKKLYQEISDTAKKEEKKKVNKILDLSFEQESNVISTINKILEFDDNTIYELKNNIKMSIDKSSSIRKQMEKLSASSSSEYIKRKNYLLENKTSLLSRQLELESQINELNFEYQNITLELNKSQSLLESEIKKESINDISVKAVVMLDNLQEELYKDRIVKLEENIKKNIKVLMTKDSLINDVSIDNDFGIHIYQNQKLLIKDLIGYIKDEESERKISSNYKNDLILKAENKNKTLAEYLSSLKNSDLLVPMEISMSSLSAGEKQMFIMSLYLSLVQLGNKKIPFVIDTPFARIDKDHRINISKYFFNSLKGQVFILSTNKELDKEHTKLLGKKISKYFTLINKDNYKTNIIVDKYF